VNESHYYSIFSPTQNQQLTAKAEKAAKPAKLSLTGHISTAGELVLPAKPWLI
jgi:hypothetical protein